MVLGEREQGNRRFLLCLIFICKMSLYLQWKARVLAVSLLNEVAWVLILIKHTGEKGYLFGKCCHG